MGALLPHDVQVRLVLIWGPFPAIVAVISMAMFLAYRITRARHAEIAAALRLKRALDAGGPAGAPSV